jgi:hypothetical protein
MEIFIKSQDKEIVRFYKNFVDDIDRPQLPTDQKCQARIKTKNEQCSRNPIPGTPYCHQHTQKCNDLNTNYHSLCENDKGSNCYKYDVKYSTPYIDKETNREAVDVTKKRLGERRLTLNQIKSNEQRLSACANARDNFRKRCIQNKSFWDIGHQNMVEDLRWRAKACKTLSEKKESEEERERYLNSLSKEERENFLQEEKQKEQQIIKEREEKRRGEEKILSELEELRKARDKKSISKISKKAEKKAEKEAEKERQTKAFEEEFNAIIITPQGTPKIKTHKETPKIKTHKETSISKIVIDENLVDEITDVDILNHLTKNLERITIVAPLESPIQNTMESANELKKSIENKVVETIEKTLTSTDLDKPKPKKKKKSKKTKKKDEVLENELDKLSGKFDEHIFGDNIGAVFYFQNFDPSLFKNYKDTMINILNDFEMKYNEKNKSYTSDEYFDKFILPNKDIKRLSLRVRASILKEIKKMENTMKQ